MSSFSRPALPKNGDGTLGGHGAQAGNSAAGLESFSNRLDRARIDVLGCRKWSVDRGAASHE